MRAYRLARPLRTTLASMPGLMVPYVQVPLDMLLVPRFAERTLEENEQHRVVVDKIGITKRIQKKSSSALGRMPQHLDWPVKTKEDFRKIKEKFNAEDPRRIGVTWSKELVEYYNSQRGVPIGLHVPGFYGTARELMGMERLLVSFYKDPELMSEIFAFWADFILKMISKALPFRIDSRKSGRTWPTRMAPTYRQDSSVNSSFRTTGASSTN